VKVGEKRTEQNRKGEENEREEKRMTERKVYNKR
jgi:hypothetical protein